MRISELSARTGVPVATIKYYLRERLLPEGERSAPTQATYGERHVERLRVVRALIESGVSVAETRRVLDALDDPPASPTTCSEPRTPPSCPRPSPTSTYPPPNGSSRDSGGRPGMCDDQVLAGVARALQGLDRAGFEVPDVVMSTYLDAIGRIARAEIAGVPTDSPEAAVRYVVLGSVLVEPLLLALRRVAEQIASAERFGGADAESPGAVAEAERAP